MKTLNTILLLAVTAFLIKDIFYVFGAWSAFHPLNITQHSIFWGSSVVILMHGAVCIKNCTGFVPHLKLFTSITLQLLLVALAVLSVSAPFVAHGYDGPMVYFWLFMAALGFAVMALMFWSLRIARAQQGAPAGRAASGAPLS